MRILLVRFGIYGNANDHLAGCTYLYFLRYYRSESNGDFEVQGVVTLGQRKSFFRRIPVFVIGQQLKAGEKYNANEDNLGLLVNEKEFKIDVQKKKEVKII